MFSTSRERRRGKWQGLRHKWKGGITGQARREAIQASKGEVGNLPWQDLHPGLFDHLILRYVNSVDAGRQVTDHHVLVVIRVGVDRPAAAVGFRKKGFLGLL